LLGPDLTEAVAEGDNLGGDPAGGLVGGDAIGLAGGIVFGGQPGDRQILRKLSTRCSLG